MGVFIGYYGDHKIPEEKREEFIRRAWTLLDVGGMMSIDETRILGKRVGLLYPPMPGLYAESEGEKDRKVFYYNYFEQQSWEPGILDTKTGYYHTGKVGDSVFYNVAVALDILREFYTVGLANTGTDSFDAGHYIGWFNYLFGEHWGNDRIWRILGAYRKDPEWQYRQDLDEFIPASVTARADLLRAVDEIAERGDLDALKHIGYAMETVREQTKSSFLSFLGTMYSFLSSLREFNRESAGDAKEVISVLKSEKTVEFGEPLFHMNFQGHLLPLDLTSKITAAYFSLDYKAIREELRDSFPENEQVAHWKERYREIPADKLNEEESLELVKKILHSPVDWESIEAEAEPFAFDPVDTNQFLSMSLTWYDKRSPITGDDRAHWWTPDNDVELSTEMLSWLDSLHAELDEIEASDELIPTKEVLPTLVRAISKGQETFYHPFFFGDTFYEFLCKADNSRYQAAAILLGRILERSGKDADILVSRYCAVLSNEALRHKIFGF